MWCDYQTRKRMNDMNAPDARRSKIAEEVTVISDESTLRTLANPLRMRILALLRVRGELNVGEICDILQLASGSVSYHLRTLSKAGLAEKVEHAEDGRRSWWKATSWAMTPPVADEQQDDRSVGEYLKAVSNTYREIYNRYLEVREQEPSQWQDASMNEDRALCLSAEELSAMNAELDAVAQRWQNISHGREESCEFRRVALIIQSFPWMP